jgi:UDP-N-acetylglucosamine 3-dehydrogenase
MRTVRFGVIGCGFISKLRHFPELELNPQAQICAVCDADESRASKVARKYEATVYTNYKDLLECAEVEAVVICLPPHLHPEVAVYALERGVHVMCEKPMATSLIEAERMIDAAERTGTKLMIGFNQRFVPSHTYAYQLIRSGAIGRITGFHSVFGHSGPEHWSLDGNRSFYFNSKQLPFGVLGDLSIHKIDLIRYLLQDECTEINGILAHTGQKQADVYDYSVLSLRMAGGAVGTITSSWSYALQEHTTIVYGENGNLYMECDDQFPLRMMLRNQDAVTYKIPAIMAYERQREERSGVIHGFIDAIVNDKPVPVSGRDGYMALKAILAGYDSALTGKTISL